MSKDEVDIADMQCWLVRMAQRRWNVEPAQVANIFAANDVLGFVTRNYGLLYLGSYESALDDIQAYLASRGVFPCAA